MRNSLDDERGAAAVELALLLPILLVLVFGIIEFGRGYNAKLTLTHAAREAARAYAVGHDSDEVESVVSDATSSLDSSNLTIANLSDLSTPCTAGDEVHVELAYTLDYVIPFFKSGTFDLDATGSMRCAG